MVKYKAYPEYKDSGVEWLGEIPIHWICTQIKYGYDITLGKMLQKNKSSSKDELKPYLKAQNIQPKGIDLSVVDNMWFSPDEKNKLLLKNNDVLISEGGDVGRSALWQGQLVECYIQNAINRARAIKGNSPYFLNYWMVYLKSADFINTLCNKATIPHYTAEKVETSPLLLPNCDEQLHISLFLDHETAKIDNLIKKQQQLIELLKEKRQAVISHAVTKGLNPNVPMKDSGVKWLGKLPSHWQALPTKRLFRLVAEPAEINNDYELLSVYTAIGVAPRKDLEPKGNKASTTDGYWKVRQGDIIVNKLLAWMGAVGFSNYDGVTSPAYDILRKVKDINPKFYHYLFRLELTQREFKRWSRGIMEMRLRLYFEELGRIIMPVPPRQEQDVIVEEIEKIEHQYSQLENIASHQIDLLKERRTALISAAVTGKIDVRDWVAPDTQDVEEPQEATA
ncbi:restriction endonuclease subunit S [Enterobacter mori]|uniref:restriction endonuclease subunit S n=1 Tax=Enterobacter mori TaxID=539813 RepID=UPI00190050CE|nr:restriction endonuclease subunit S [Enterobacter mori]